MYDGASRRFLVYATKPTKRAVPAMAVGVDNLTDAQTIALAAEAASAFTVQHGDHVRRTLSVLTVVACATLPLGSSIFEQQLVPTVLLGLVFAVLAVVGFRFVESRGRALAVLYLEIQLALGFGLFWMSGAPSWWPP